MTKTGIVMAILWMCVWIWLDMCLASTSYENNCELVATHTKSSGEIFNTFKCISEVDGRVYYMIETDSGMDIILKDNQQCVQ